eukprot:5071338-Alexandrium_andersonii.AAC.1
MSDAKRLSVEMGGFQLSTDLEKSMEKHAKRVELLWRATQKLVDANSNDEQEYDKLRVKFALWSEWYHPRYDAGRAMAQKMKAKGKKTDKEAAAAK